MYYQNISTIFVSILGWASIHHQVTAFSPSSWTRTDKFITPKTSSKSTTILNLSSVNIQSTSSWFGTDATTNPSNKFTTEQLKAQILQLGATLDRGQGYNPTSGSYYEGTMNAAKSKINDLIKSGNPSINLPKLLSDMDGEWELVMSTVPHGIFRSSPFFLAVQEAFQYAEEKEAFGEPKANLFFKLHELQTCSWGVSKIGRVAQRVDSKTNYLYSEFDTSIFSLTVIPILGWFKLLPTFGGCVITASKYELVNSNNDDGKNQESKLLMEVDYTTSRPVPGLSGLGEWIWKVKVPVGFVWKILPWNKGRKATCSVFVRYLDQDFRVVEDIDGEYFVYTRPVVPRALDLIES